MAKGTTRIGIYFVVLTALITASCTRNDKQETKRFRNESHTAQVGNNTSRKRQEIIYLQSDSPGKRNRQGETMAQMERHGKTLSAEGNVFKGTAGKNSYEESFMYRDPSVKEQSASKYIGPPDIKENEKKSDAYEVLGETDEDNYKSSMNEDTKAPHVLRVHTTDRELERDSQHHRSGLHIVSLTDDLDAGKVDKDSRLYGSIGYSPSSLVRRRTHHSRHRHRSRGHFRYDPYDFLPQNVVSLSQDDLLGPFSRHGIHTRQQIFPGLIRREPNFVSSPSALSPQDDSLQGLRSVSPQSISYGGRPNLFLVPVFNGRSDTDPSTLPVTAQSALPASQPQMEEPSANYQSAPPTGSFRNGLLFQPALQVPLIQTQSDSLPYTMSAPGQREPQVLFDSQQPDLRSLYQYQLQNPPQLQNVQLPALSQAQSRPFIIPTSMALEPDLLGSMAQEDTGLSRWVDEDGHARSEVLDQRKEPSMEDSYRDDRNNDEDYNYGEYDRQRSRYRDSDEESPMDNGDDDGDQEDQTSDSEGDHQDAQDDERPTDEDSEESDDTDNEPNDENANRPYEGNELAADDEQTPTFLPPAGNDGDNEEQEDQRAYFAPRQRSRQFNPRAFSRALGLDRQNYVPPALPLNFPAYRVAQPSEAPAELGAQSLARYQPPFPSSAVKEQNLPKPPPEPKPTSDTSPSNLKISQLSPAEAQFFENKATLDPNFAPPITSKDTIPGKLRNFQGGFGKVLIRLNGIPLEDSTQLRSKVIDGKFVQGKGKMIKSKGPIRVKLSHTKDAKHMKIVDIITPKQFQVYDTKSKIRRPQKSSRTENSTGSPLTLLPKAKR